MPNQLPQLDRVFKALADPTRIAVIERLGRGSASASQLAEPFNMALPSFTQHLRILEDCGLVTSQKTGRTRVYELRREGLAPANHWLEEQHAKWTARLDQLAAFLRTTREQQS